MSADAGSGSGRKTLGSQSSTTSSSGSTTTGGSTGGRRRREYGKKDRKIVRILTVVAYIMSVSAAAVLLSAYYVFLWSPTPPSAKGQQQQYVNGNGQVDEPRVLQFTSASEHDERSTDSTDFRERPLMQGPVPVRRHSFALSASQIDLRHVIPKKIPKNNYDPGLHYVNTNTRAYQQRQIPTPPSTLVLMTKILTTEKAPGVPLVVPSTTPISLHPQPQPQHMANTT